METFGSVLRFILIVGIGVGGGVAITYAILVFRQWRRRRELSDRCQQVFNRNEFVLSDKELSIRELKSRLSALGCAYRGVPAKYEAWMQCSNCEHFKNPHSNGYDVCGYCWLAGGAKIVAVPSAFICEEYQSK